MTCCPTQKQKDHIASLESAYEKLISGAGVAVAVDSNGERVEWQRGNMQALRNYIREKKIEYCITTASTGGPIRMLM